MSDYTSGVLGVWPSCGDPGPGGATCWRPRDHAGTRHRNRDTEWDSPAPNSPGEDLR